MPVDPVARRTYEGIRACGWVIATSRGTEP